MRGESRRRDEAWWAALLFLGALYLLFMGFVLRAGRSPVDYGTFMAIGRRFLAGEPVYGENSYYPLPFVLIFALFSRLPFALSVTLWLGIPVLLALWMTRWRPWVLAYAPLFGHFVGGQASVVGMLGLWGYRRHQDVDDAVGGLYLALMFLKPQLGIVPLAYAVVQWWRAIRITRRAPRQLWGWLGALTALYLPAFFIMPDWVVRWLSSPRPLFARALVGFIPRTLLMFLNGSSAWYWVLWLGLSALVTFVLWRRFRPDIDLDKVVLWGFVVNPLLHDYDLIQLIPLLEECSLQRVAVLLSIPGWLVIVLAYRVDVAWIAFSWIAPGLLLYRLWRSGTSQRKQASGNTD